MLSPLSVVAASLVVIPEGDLLLLSFLSVILTLSVSKGKNPRISPEAPTHPTESKSSAGRSREQSTQTSTDIYLTPPSKRRTLFHKFAKGFIMRRSLFSVIILASAFALPLAAHANPIDNFVLTGPGLTMTFSLPASPGFINEYNPFDPSIIYGFTVTTPFTAIENGQTYTNPSVFFESNVYTGSGLYLGIDNFESLALRSSPAIQPFSTDPTFLTGSFSLYYGVPTDVFKLTITPRPQPRRNHPAWRCSSPELSVCFF